jgi:hypothetical protein
VKVEHHELGSAFVEFLAAKRTLRQAYQESELCHTPAQLIPMLEGSTSDQIGIELGTPEQMQKLKDENARLRKLIALLYSYSLRVHEELEAPSSLHVRRSVSPQVRRNC